MSNVDGTSRSELQKFASPLKVVHGSDCSSSPSLTIQLDTDVLGSLSINGARVSHSPFRLLKCLAPSPSSAAGKCAGVNGANVNMKTCDMSNVEIQLRWYGKMIATGSSGSTVIKCWLVQHTDSNVVSATCDNTGSGGSKPAALMHFTFDEATKTITNQNSGAGKCMQCGIPGDDGNVEIRMATCSGSDHQKWYWWEPGDS